MSDKKETPKRELPARSSRGQKDALNNYDLLEQTRLWEERQRLEITRLKRLRKQSGEVAEDDDEEEQQESEPEQQDEEPVKTVKRSTNKRKKATARKAARKKSDTVESNTADDTVDADETEDQSVDDSADVASEKVDEDAAEVEKSAKKAKSSKQSKSDNADSEEHDNANDDRKEATTSILDIEHYKTVVKDIIHKLTDYDSITAFMTHAAASAKERIHLLSNDAPTTNETSAAYTTDTTEQRTNNK